VSEPAQRVTDVRVGSATDGLAPVSVAERSLAAGLRQWAALGVVVLAAVLADQLTKHLVSSRLAIGEELAVAGSFAIHHVQNSGIAFGFFADATWLVIPLTSAATVWMLIYFARSGARHPILPVGLGLVIGGSLSNLADRVRLGHVTDFLDVRYWPAFNLADTFIVVGVGVLLAALVAADREPRRRRVSAEASAPRS
jgi:signal peptidase II